MEAAAPTKHLRADAERNRRRVLDAAHEVLCARGLEASLDEVARVAGVGIGTVYRRFPDRGALVSAVLSEIVDRAAEAMTAAAEAEADPRARLRAVSLAYAEEIAANQALFDVVRTRPQEVTGLESVKRRVQEAMHAPLRDAQEAGVVRGDLETRDLTLLFAAVARIRPAEPEQRNRWRRELAIVLDGLAPQQASKLPR